MSPGRRCRGLIALASLLVGQVVPTEGQTGPADPGRGIPSAGAGFLWGRLQIEAESPEGPWTPLAGVEVVAYPGAAALLARLEHIRHTARDSGRHYETAVARIQEALQGHARQLDPRRSPVAPGGGAGDAGTSRPAGFGPPTPGPDDHGVVRRGVTDAAGVFVFDALPAGEWLVVAVRVAPYSASPARREEPRGARGRQQFAGTAVAPAREAEIWIERVRVDPGSRTRLLWSDRGRWFVGPLR